jgi:hypothetical protein
MNEHRLLNAIRNEYKVGRAEGMQGVSGNEGYYFIKENSEDLSMKMTLQQRHNRNGE